MEREAQIQELELQLVIVQVAAEMNTRKFRRWTVGLTLLMGFLAMFAIGSPWMGIAIGGIVFIVMWSGYTASRKQYQARMKWIREQIFAVRQQNSDRKWDERISGELLWPVDHEHS